MARRQQYIFSDEPRRGKGALIGLLIVLLILLGYLLRKKNFLTDGFLAVGS